jgi:hypothetical protein
LMCPILIICDMEYMEYLHHQDEDLVYFESSIVSF